MNTHINILDHVPFNLRANVVLGKRAVNHYYYRACLKAYEDAEAQLREFNLFTLGEGSKSRAGAFNPPPIFFPAGNYKWHETIEVMPMISIQGAGKNRTNFFSQLDKDSKATWKFRHNLNPSVTQAAQIVVRGPVKVQGSPLYSVSQEIRGVTIAPDFNFSLSPDKICPIVLEDQTTEFVLRDCNILAVSKGRCDSLITSNYFEGAMEWIDRKSAFDFLYGSVDQTSNWTIDAQIKDNLLEGGEIAQVILSGHNISFQGNQQYYTSCPFMFMNVNNSCITGNSLYPPTNNTIGGVHEAVEGYLYGTNNTLCNNANGCTHPVLIVDKPNSGRNDILCQDVVTSVEYKKRFKEAQSHPAFIKAWKNRFGF